MTDSSLQPPASGPYCSKPWTDLELDARGARTCCSAWLDRAAYVHDSDEADPWKLWNAEPIQRLRRAVAAGDRSLCRGCAWLRSGTQPQLDVADPRPVVEHGPKVLADCVDRTCNLHCSSCRKQPIGPPKNWRDLATRLEMAIGAFGATLETYSTSQIGDPFASPVSHRALRSHWLTWSPCKLMICTNALLMPIVWPRLPPQVRDRLQRVHVSIDAADGDTYELLRRGGNWDQLTQALNWLAMLRETGQPEVLQYQFILQADNWRQAPMFIELAKHARASCVVFTHLRRNWMPKDVWAAKTMASPDHPDRAEFDAMIDGPALRDPIVDRRHLHPDVMRQVWEAGNARP